MELQVSKRLSLGGVTGGAEGLGAGQDCPSLLGRMLADREDVAVGVFEPGYFAAVGRGPDAEGLVLGKRVLFWGDAAVTKPGGGGFDVFDLPAEDGAW